MSSRVECCFKECKDVSDLCFPTGGGTISMRNVTAGEGVHVTYVDGNRGSGTTKKRCEFDD